MNDVSRAVFDEVMVPNYAPSPIIPVAGEGSRVWDQQGKAYIDFCGGIAVNCLGHCHPELVEVLRTQGNRLWHLSNVFTNEPALRLARLLTQSTFAQKVYFANSGGEANEAALKLARRWALDHYGEGKNRIVAFNNSFHGRTFFTVTVGGQPAYSDGFGPKPGAIDHVDYNDLDQLADVISDDTCAVIMEPLQGEGGIISPSASYVHGVRELCDQYNALLILDEVQTGVGRTGELYAYMGLDVTPDILTTAKALGGGFPIGAMLTTDAIASSFKVGTHGSTYGGNPLACAVAEKVFTIVNDPALLSGVKLKERRFRELFEEINHPHQVFSEMRGKGLLLGLALTEEYRGRAREFLQAAAARGLMCLVAGPDVVRFAPSLLISDQQITEGMYRFKQAVADIVAGSKVAGSKVAGSKQQ